MSNRTAWTPKATLTDEERRVLDCCQRAVECLKMRKVFQHTGNKADAERQLERACGLIAAARDEMERKAPIRTRDALEKHLARVTPRHAATLSLYLMCWELRYFPHQIPLELQA